MVTHLPFHFIGGTTNGSENSSAPHGREKVPVPRDGRFIEEIGYYNPLEEPAVVKVDVEKAQKWIANGAQPTDTVKDLLKRAGV